MADAPLRAPTLRALPGGGWFAFAHGEAAPAEAPPRDVPPLPALPAAAAFTDPPPPAPPRRASGLAALHLSLGGIALAVPAALAEHILPMPALRPMPGAPAGVAGLAEAGGAPVLVLHTAFAAGLEDAAGEEPALLLVLHQDGRRFGLPAARIAAGPATPAMAAFAGWLGTPAARDALAHAPPATEAAPLVPVPQRHLVICRVAGMEIALPAESVVAVLAPTEPLPTPPRLTSGPGLAGLAAHRGAVLPVLDGGLVLGGAAALAPGGVKEPAPLIRLAVRPEVLVAVEHVAGVRALPAAGITPLVLRDGLVQGIARLGGAPLPVLSPHRLGAL
ncbi:hypothetical protein EJV46_01435 [Roseococcus sp. SYP-B2431]|uniref:chemotaxis protein CheW n=1 Tax=Roseococcus sp. SYP-B2431 TaxID=2496640 RepID=UPI00103CCE5B|nr:chemotaxis protein CheW [Roseococcus sp. SYP-B2431]TCI00669.1 hypothetical protein EJV46_01435 [Roseococcus sp. SYP-B2431]